LSSYVGSALTSSGELYYRNLDGTGTVHREVPRDIGTLTTTATLTKSSSSGGMIIQEFTLAVTSSRGPIYTARTMFGFFPPEALARQVGVGSSEAERARLAAPCTTPLADGASFPVDLKQRAPEGAGDLALPAQSLLMIDRITGYWPSSSSSGLARVRTVKTVDLGEWFFRAHFYQDPVQPGSLGIEAMVQALMWIARHEHHHVGMRKPRFEALACGTPMTWKYRGQVVPKNTLIQVEVDVVEFTNADGAVTLRARGALWVDGLRIYLADDLAVRIVDDG
jgi:3-hydroxymyristoyl/3-hydroxydecanoyl-(acyl carrier protein) dehydratase